MEKNIALPKSTAEQTSDSAMPMAPPAAITMATVSNSVAKPNDCPSASAANAHTLRAMITNPDPLSLNSSTTTEPDIYNIFNGDDESVELDLKLDQEMADALLADDVTMTNLSISQENLSISQQEPKKGETITITKNVVTDTRSVVITPAETPKVAKTDYKIPKKPTQKAASHPLVGNNPYQKRTSTTSLRSVEGALKRHRDAQELKAMGIKKAQDAKAARDKAAAEAALTRAEDQVHMAPPRPTEQAPPPQVEQKPLPVDTKDMQAAFPTAAEANPIGPDPTITPRTGPTNGYSNAVCLPAASANTIIYAIVLRFNDVGAQHLNSVTTQTLFPKRTTLSAILNRIEPECQYFTREAYNQYLFTVLASDAKFAMVMAREGIMTAPSVIAQVQFETHVSGTWITASEAAITPYKIKITNATPHQHWPTPQITARIDYDGYRTIMEPHTTNAMNRMSQCDKHFKRYRETSTIELAQILNGITPTTERPAEDIDDTTPPASSASTSPVSIDETGTRPRDNHRPRDISRNRRDLNSRNAPLDRRERDQQQGRRYQH